jgi:hypothetical protein
MIHRSKIANPIAISIININLEVNVGTRAGRSSEAEMWNEN